MIVTAFWSKNFSGVAPVVSPSNASATLFLDRSNASDFPLVTSSEDNSFPFNLGETLPGWRLVQALNPLSNTREVWTTLIDQPSQIAVHLICYGYDEILVTLEPVARSGDNSYLTQSAVFYCQPDGKDTRIVFNQGADGSFSQLMITPMSDPSSGSASHVYAWNGLVVQWVVGIEEPLCGDYTGAFPGTGINICPTSSASPTPVKSSPAPTK
jgi:hypothetical protein